jgi:hypothetical protein
LLFAVLFWSSLSDYQLALNLFVSMATAVVALQAPGVGKHYAVRICSQRASCTKLCCIQRSRGT